MALLRKFFFTSRVRMGYAHPHSTGEKPFTQQGRF